jgi:hypothetical protein
MIYTSEGMACQKIEIKNTNEANFRLSNIVHI